MKKIKIISLFLIIYLFLMGCSNKKSVNEEDIKYILNNIKIENLVSMEFDNKDTTLRININNEFIDDEDVKLVLKNVVLNNKSSFEAFSLNNVNYNIFNVEIKNNQGNTIKFNTEKVDKYELDLVSKIYTESYIESYISNISKSIIKLNSLVGKIEVDLKQNIDVSEKIEEFKKIKVDIEDNINYFSKFNKNNSNFAQLDDINLKFNSILKMLDIEENVVQTAVSSGQSVYIDNSFLTINELDRIARELQNKNY